jgi:IclR family transcriptional regulator, acetate operon repressor
VVQKAGRQDSLSGTLERGLAILEFLSATGEASVSMIAEGLGLSRSATYRIVDSLKEMGYLEINPASERYRLGLRAAEIGMAALVGIDVVRLAPAYLRELAASTRETAFLAVVDDEAVVYVYKEEGPQPVTMSSQLGSRRPLYCTGLGKAYLSMLDDESRRALLSRIEMKPLTPNTITDPAALEAELLLTRERGYAIDNVEVEEGVACFAAAVLDYRRQPVGAISVAGPAERVLARGKRLGELVSRTARTLSRRLGYVERAGDLGGVPREG